MCGRYAAAKDVADLVLEFDIDLDETAGSGLTADFNVAPTKVAPVVLSRPLRTPDGPTGDPVRQLRALRWGLVPSWAKDPSVGARMINARAETLLDKGAFVKAGRSRRCLVPADGYYEWQVVSATGGPKGKPVKVPMWIHRADGAGLAMAGVYEFWRDRSVAGDDPAAWLTTYAVITTAADPDLAAIHDRQPLILEREDWDAWLDPGMTDPGAIQLMLDFAEPGRLAAYPVSTAVNNHRNNGPELIEPAPESESAAAPDSAPVERRP